MATVLRKGKLRVIVYSRDHPPPHEHVVTPRGQAKILVEGSAGHPKLEWNLGLTRRDLILAEWKRIHEHP